MKRNTAFRIALALSVVLASMANSASAAQQGNRGFRADTGILTLGPNQVLRLTVAAGDVNGDGSDILVRFRRIDYSQDPNSGCGDALTPGACKYVVAAQATTAPVRLMPGEAASFDIDAAPNGDLHMAIRAVVLSSSRNVRATAMIIDAPTGKVVAALDLNDLFI